jgi:hypothetical protein
MAMYTAESIPIAALLLVSLAYGNDSDPTRGEISGSD